MGHGAFCDGSSIPRLRVLLSQVFRRGALERALALPPHLVAAATDEAWLVEHDGGSVRVVAAPAENIKVTTPRDLALAELLLAARVD